MNRRAFTLIELLVVIAIIGVLVGLLIPAVQSARESARLTSCGNSLKQIGVALQNYQDVRQSFPPYLSPPPGGNIREWCWSTYILPYIEQSDIYNQLNVTTYTFNQTYAGTTPGTAPQELLATAIPAMRCPSNVTANIKDTSVPVGVIHYSACRGYGQAGWNGDEACNNGALNWSGVTFDEIPDGLSHTFLVGESSREFNPTRVDGYGLWAGVPTDNTYGSGTYLLQQKTLSRCSTFGINTSDWAFSTAHAKVANFLLCDGSVQKISTRIDINRNGQSTGWYGGSALQRTVDAAAGGMGVYHRLTMRSDGQAALLPKL